MVNLVTLQREFGPMLPQLPSVEAGSLPSGLQRRLRRFVRAMEQSFTTEDVLPAMVEAGERLFPGDAIAVFPSVHRGVPTWMLHNFSGAPTSAPIRNAAFLPRAALYRSTVDDPFAGRAVNITSLYGLYTPAIASRFDIMHGAILESNGMHHQLRAVLYDRGNEAELFIGFYRRAGQKIFSVDEHVLLQLALPIFLDWYRVTRVVGLHPLGDGALATALESNTAACWLVDQGRVVFANKPARALPTVPSWVVYPTPSALARRVALAPSGRPLTLVLGPARSPPTEAGERKSRPSVPDLAGLPPALREVAKLAMEGQSDKEIAQALDRPLATVRTYMARTLVRLGLHGRRELMRRS